MDTASERKTMRHSESATRPSPEEDDDEGGGPLPLSELKRWLLLSDDGKDDDDTYRWIQDADEKDAAFRREMEERGTADVANLFGADDSDSDEQEDPRQRQQQTAPSRRRRRVQRWSSSATNPDGIFGDDETAAGIRVAYVMSDSWEGFGGTLWSSARHVANQLADPIRCRRLLSPLFDRSTKHNDNGDRETHCNRHPLFGVRFVELGSGAGLPSLTAMWCGARVVATDMSKANRIRCLAESLERNWREMGDPTSEAGTTGDRELLQQAEKARACPYDWGRPIDRVVSALNGSTGETGQFEVLVAADCCYGPSYHSDLLDSIRMLLSDDGVALLPFALHGNVSDEDVWGIVNLARDEKGFEVEVLESQQLMPPKPAMEAKQGLVHTLRLTKPRK